VNAKIIDLGLAKGAVAEDDSISSLGTFVGTPQYANPEQFAGTGADIRSDLYSLGITLWEMLSGKLPFQGSSAELMQQHRHAVLPMEKLAGFPRRLLLCLKYCWRKIRPDDSKLRPALSRLSQRLPKRWIPDRGSAQTNCVHSLRNRSSVSKSPGKTGEGLLRCAEDSGSAGSAGWDWCCLSRLACGWSRISFFHCHSCISDASLAIQARRASPFCLLRV
jgi:serine/threonine protein kinase